MSAWKPNDRRSGRTSISNSFPGHLDEPVADPSVGNSIGDDLSGLASDDLLVELNGDVAVPLVQNFERRASGYGHIRDFLSVLQISGGCAFALRIGLILCAGPLEEEYPVSALIGMFGHQIKDVVPLAKCSAFELFDVEQREVPPCTGKARPQLQVWIRDARIRPATTKTARCLVDPAIFEVAAVREHECIPAQGQTFEVIPGMAVKVFGKSLEGPVCFDRVAAPK